MGINLTPFLINVLCVFCFIMLGLFICLLELWHLKCAVVQEWIGQWGLAAVLWILGRLAEKDCDAFWIFFLLLLGTQEQMFDQIKLFSQKKRISLSAVHLPWQWILKVLESVTRVFPVHPLCSCYTSAPLLRKGCASARSRVSSSWKGAEWEGCCTVDCLPSLSLTLSQSLSSGNCYSFPIFFSH